jgi:tetratricopeptide (TPR) repeat protein
MTRLALELEHELADDPAVREGQLPLLIETWRRSDAPERALRWQVEAMGHYNHAGLYEASLPYADAVQAGLERLGAEDRALYFAAVSVLYFCYVPLGRAEAARAIMERALTRVEDAGGDARLSYLLSMLHARFLKPADQAKAEAYLQRALDVLANADLPDGERHFLTVFTMNGLAFVRLRQGRLQEAVQLCRDGVARLNEHLDPERHRLHRSVLLFNIAQVHAQIGPYEDAIAYFSQAMEMDPNYSEYYNDRGAVFFKMNRLEDAERDYLQAIELSPPYAEVWTNLGQCYRAMERLDDAVRAYTRALDLDPDCTLAVVGRADALFALDRAELALEDYDRALAAEPEQPVVLGSRSYASSGSAPPVARPARCGAGADGRRPHGRGGGRRRVPGPQRAGRALSGKTSGSRLGSLWKPKTSPMTMMWSPAVCVPVTRQSSQQTAPSSSAAPVEPC